MTQDLLHLAELYCRQVPAATLDRLGHEAAGDTTLFFRLRAGRGVSCRAADRALTWFHRHWPEGLDWPPTVPRPSDYGPGLTLGQPGFASIAEARSAAAHARARLKAAR